MQHKIFEKVKLAFSSSIELISIQGIKYLDNCDIYIVVYIVTNIAALTDMEILNILIFQHNIFPIMLNYLQREKILTKMIELILKAFETIFNRERIAGSKTFYNAFVRSNGIDAIDLL